jgi:hypothetical protein
VDLNEDIALNEDVEDRVDGVAEVSRADTGDNRGAETRYGVRVAMNAVAIQPRALKQRVVP